MMEALGDILSSLFNFRFIGKVLTRRPAGKVAVSFFFLVVIYVIIFGSLYSSVTSNFVNAALDLSKPMLPAFDIINGKLIMHTREPYILTHKDIYEIIKEAVFTVDKEHFKGRYKAELQQSLEEGHIFKESFCLVMDTTGTYREKVNLEDYMKYIVLTKDSIEVVDRIKNMPGNIIPISSRIKNDIIFKPEFIDRVKLPVKRFFIIAVILDLSLFTLIRFLLKALISAFIIWLILLVIRKKIAFGTIYKISLYALSPIVLLAVISFLWIPLPGFLFQLVYFCYIILALSVVNKYNKEVQSGLGTQK